MTAERDTLKRQHGKLFAAVSEVLFEGHPMGINFEITLFVRWFAAGRRGASLDLFNLY